MIMRCPRCGSTRIVPVGQYDKLIYFGLAGTIVLGFAGFRLPIFWLLLPFWWLGCLLFYVKRPLAACDECNHQWNPRKP
ncbi:MAG: hypothetical protein AB1507_00620 [Bacillota bacterium]|jgi:hypothetical protein|nr:hypothetical protein [Thermoanaerobacteraceae bacterium]